MPVVVAPSSPSLQQQQGDAPQLPAVVGGGQGGEVPQHPLLTQSISSAYLQQQANVPPQGNIGGPPPSLYSSPSYSSSQAGAGDTSSIGTQMASPALQGGQPQPLLSSLQVPSVTPQQIQAITQLSPPSNLMTPSLPSPSAPAPPSPLQQQQEYIGVPASVAGGTGISALPSIPALGGGTEFSFSSLSGFIAAVLSSPCHVSSSSSITCTFPTYQYAQYQSAAGSSCTTTVHAPLPSFDSCSSSRGCVSTNVSPVSSASPFTIVVTISSYPTTTCAVSSTPTARSRT